MPVRQCRLAHPVVLDTSASELDAQSSSSDSSDSQSESSGSSGSESSQINWSSSSDSDTQKAEPQSPPVPKPSPKSVFVPGTMGALGPPPFPKPNQTSGTLGATRGPQAPPCPKPASMPGPIAGDPRAISGHRMVDVLLQSTGESSSAAPIERPKKYRRGADASKPKPKPKPKPSPEYIYFRITTIVPNHCSAAPLSILWGGGGTVHFIGGGGGTRRSVSESRDRGLVIGHVWPW